VTKSHSIKLHKHSQ